MLPPDSLDPLRSQIDEIDHQVVRLLNQRVKIALDIGKLKKTAGADFYAPQREQAVCDRLTQINSGPFPQEALRKVFREIMQGTLSVEGGVTVAYLGPEATFTHMACLARFGASARVRSMPNIKAVFEAVEKGDVEYGMVPVENSIEGVVNPTLDLLADSPVLIYGEVFQPIAHFLMSKTGKREDIQAIYSHPHATAQCSRFLTSQFRNIPVLESGSTAMAAQKTLEEESAAAIASELAATLYGLHVIEKNIEDYRNNVTRFLLLSRTPAKRTGGDKTSILFSIADRAGGLCKVLQPFSDQQLNLTRIESRPSKKKPWEYLFYIDVLGHPDDENMKPALNRLKEKSLFLKILGAYKRADSTESRYS